MARKTPKLAAAVALALFAAAPAWVRQVPREGDGGTGLFEGRDWQTVRSRLDESGLFAHVRAFADEAGAGPFGEFWDTLAADEAGVSRNEYFQIFEKLLANDAEWARHRGKAASIRGVMLELPPKQWHFLIEVQRHIDDIIWEYGVGTGIQNIKENWMNAPVQAANVAGRLFGFKFEEPYQVERCFARRDMMIKRLRASRVPREGWEMAVQQSYPEGRSFSSQHNVLCLKRGRVELTADAWKGRIYPARSFWIESQPEMVREILSRCGNEFCGTCYTDLLVESYGRNASNPIEGLNFSKLDDANKKVFRPPW